MYIHEAVRKVQEINGYIIRKSIYRPEQDIYVLVRPTNSYETCLLIVYKNGKPERSARAWNPTADDLVADDWECLGNQKENEM